VVRHPPVIIPSGDTLLDVLKWRAEHQPDQTAYVFLRDGIARDAVLTYAELDSKARSIAGYLRTRFTPGECLLLVYPPGLDFVQAFWGALYAGLIAVPVPPPDTFRLTHSTARLQRLADDARPSGAMSTSQIRSMLRQQDVQDGSIRLESWLSLDDVGSNPSAQWTLTHPLPATLAYLQYTSGSTSAPKGVMVSHGNMTAQSRCITHAGSVQCPFRDVILDAAFS